MATSSKALRRRSLPHARVPNGTGFQPFQPQLAEGSLCSFTAPSFEELLRTEQMVSPVFRNRCFRNRFSHPSSALQTTRQDRPSQTPCLRRRQLDTVTNLHQAESTHAMFTPGTRKSRADKSGRTCKSMRHTRGISTSRAFSWNPRTPAYEASCLLLRS